MMNPRRNRWRRAGRLAAFLILVLVVLGVAAYGYLRSCVATPPPLPAELAITNLVPETRGDRVWLGRNWLARWAGLNVLYLTGPPFDRGYANGALTQPLVRRQEQVIVDLLNTMVPRRWEQLAITLSVLFQTRYLPRYVSPEIQTEVLGLVHGCPDVRPQDGPYYHRVLSYHAAQDISYMLMNHPLVRGGCTGFAAWGPTTVDGHLLCGRNFDWEAAPVFDEDRVLVLCEPDRGIPFVSLAWAGMAGCVSGMNRAGVCIAVNGAPSNLPRHARTPTCLVAREVLQYAHNLDEATAIIRRSQVFVSALFLVGSRADGRFVVVEKTPTQTAIQPATGEAFLVQGNHYLTDALKDDPVNVKYLQVDTSLSRSTRMAELLRAAAGQLDAARAAAVLRDRQLPGGVFAGNGHRGALNPLIATHAVIMDLTDGIFWAGCPPHQLGKFVAVDVNEFRRVVPERDLPADPFPYATYQQARQHLATGQAALRRKDYAAAAAAALEAERLNPGFYENALLLGEARLRAGDRAGARHALAQAMAGAPALGRERKKLADLLAATQP